MSEERAGEVAAASPPPSSDQYAANNAEQQVSASDAQSTPAHQSAETSARSAQQAVTPDANLTHDEASEYRVPASASERDVEALTGLHDRTEVLSDNHAANAAALNSTAASSSPQVAGAPVKKFTSLNVNKRFLEKAGPTTSVTSPATLKLGTSVSPLPSHRLSSPSATSRLMSAKLSSVPKPQPAGWATTKPTTAPTAKSTPSSQPPAAVEKMPASAPASDAAPATAAVSADPLPAEASAPLPKAVQSPKPTNLPVSQAFNGTAAVSVAPAAVASPRLVSMGRDSPRPGSAGLESGSGQGRASPGLRNAALGSSLRAPSPANVSRAPWAGVKSSLSPNPPSTRGSKLSDFPTAAEAAKAKQEQEERAAAAAAREAAKQQAALQALDRFRGASLGSGKHWDEMEDEDGGFLGEVVEFGDGSQYKIPTSNDGSRGDADDGPPVSKEDRFKDVSHDRSWPAQRNLARPAATVPTDRARPAAAQPAAWGPLKNRDMAASSPNEPAPAPARPSRSEQRAEKVIIPTTGASVSLRSPTESRDLSGFSYGRERRPGLGAAPYGSRQDQAAPPPAAQAASAQAARAWGPLAQRQASLNPGSAQPAAATAKPSEAIETSASPAPTTASAASESVRPVATLPPVQQQQQQHQQQQQPELSRLTPQPLRDRNTVPAPREPQPAAAGPISTNGRPLPPHLLVAGSGDNRPSASAQTSRPLPPHLAQNLRPAVAAQPIDTVGRKTSHAHEEVRRPDALAALALPSNNASRALPQNEAIASHSQQTPQMRPDGSVRAPWGPKAMTQARAQNSVDAPDHQQSAPPRHAPPLASEPASEEDVHASIERARRRRQEEEQARLAERERARQKALAIEERIRAAEQQKEAEAQAAGQRRAAEAANATVAHTDAPSLRKAGPADSAPSWRAARPERAVNEDSAGPRQQQIPAMSDQVGVPSIRSPNEQTRNGRLLSSQRGSRVDDERNAHRREQREQRPVPSKDQNWQRGATVPDEITRPVGPPLDNDGRSPELAAKAELAPKTILSRPVKSPPATTPEVRVSHAAPAQPVESKSQRIVSSAADRSASKTSSTFKPREPTTQERSPRAAATAAEKAAVPVAVPVPVRLYPVVPKESLETRQEVAQDAPPAWNRFVVHLKASRTRPKLNRYQQKQLFARIAAMKAPGRAVYPLTWDPPLAHLSFKTLSRDDQLFPKRYHRGIVIAQVKLPSRVLPRGLPSIVPHVVSQSAGIGSRKQARFDLTPHWSEGQRVPGLGSQFAADAQASSLLPASQIQVRLPGHHASVVQPLAAAHLADGMQTTAGRRSHPVDAATDAIIGEVLSSGAPQSAFEDRSRSAFHAAAAPPGSLGPLDYPQTGYSADTFGSQNGAGGYRAKGRRGSNAAVAFYDERQVNTPSPVSFMVNSEIKAEAGGARGTLSPFAIPGSTRASQTQTPASAGSMLPSPSMSTQGTWGQSSLTFPVLETRSSNLPDRDHIKSVWSLATNSHAGEMQNSLKDIGDDFLPSTLPMSVHDFRADDGHSRVAHEDSDTWASFNRYQQQQYGRSQHDTHSNSRDLSPVNSRSNGFDPTSRSPALGMDASAVAAARARETGQHYSSVSQQGPNAYSSLNGGAYGHHQSSSYSPRERQQDGASGLGQSAFGAYSGYSSGTSSNNMSSMTTDALYSNYNSGGSMTPNRQSYGKYGSHASTARSAPGSPYSGMSRHAANLTSGVSGYSLFPTSGSGTSTGNVGTRSSQTSNGMEGLGVLDDSVSASFGAGRSQFYGARGYQSQQQQQQQQQPQPSQQSSTGSLGKWPTSVTGAGSNNSVNVAGSVLRPAASVFNPSKYTSQRASPSQPSRLGQHTSPSSQQQQHHQQAHHHAQADYSLDPTSSSNSGGPIDQRESSQYGNPSSGYGSGAAYSAFSSGAGLW